MNGNEENLQPYYWNGSRWAMQQAPIDIEKRSVQIDVPKGNGEIYAMRENEVSAVAKNSITLLPNPVKNNATILINSIKDENAIIRVIDNGGTIVLTQKLNLRKGLNRAALNVAALANGHYTILTNLKNAGPLKMIKGG